jgi:hypothetical protein
LGYGNLQTDILFRGEILTKGKCRVLGTEPNFRRLLGANTEIFDAAVGKRMSRKYFLIRHINERNKFIVRRNIGKSIRYSLSILSSANDYLMTTAVLITTIIDPTTQTEGEQNESFKSSFTR